MKIGGDSLVAHHYFRIKFTELNEIYMVMSLRSFAISLFVVFAPIYLYLNGNSLKNILFYYFSIYMTEFILEYPAAKLISRFGPKHIMALSMPFLILHLWFLMTYPVYHWPLWVMGLECGFVLAMFWAAYHYDFSKSKHRAKAGGEVSRLFIFLAIIGALAPLLGGLIATLLGMSYLFILVIMIVCLTIIPLLATEDSKRSGGKLNVGKINIMNIKKDLLANIGAGWEATIGMTAWPLFVFFILGTYAKVGFVTSFALLVTVVVTFYVGKKSDDGKRKKYIKYGGISSGIVCFLQTFAQTIFHVTFLNVAKSASNAVSSAPFTSEYYLHADENRRAEYIFYMESAMDIGRAFLMLVLILMTDIFSDHWVLIIALILGGIGAFLTTMMEPARCEICTDFENKKITLSRKPARNI